MAYEAPSVEVVGSIHDLTQTVKYLSRESDGVYLSHHHKLTPENS